MTGYEYVEILLVEDNPTDAELAIRALRKKNLANNLVWVRDGAEALDFLFCRGQYQDRANGSPKLILLDLKLPKVDGIEVLRTLKANEATRFVPVVMLTSSQEERDIVESYSLGVNSYIVKPVDFAKFLDMVSQVGLYWSLVNKVPSR
ncbi:MAG TPA: response regulator [Hyphomicrobiaceae bacterium]|jgi:CheY-like chemotaxis protein|nr:response regulator [Hyphomicrobiaceae bacterium]